MPAFFLHLADWLLSRCRQKLNPHDIDRAQSSVLVLLVFFPITLMTQLLEIVFSPSRPAWTLVELHGICMIVMLLLLKWTGRYQLITGLHLSLTHLLSCWYMLDRSWAYDSLYFWIPTRIVITSYILGARSATFLGAFYAISALITLELNLQNGYVLPLGQEYLSSSTQICFNAVMAILLTGIFARLYGNSQQRQQKELDEERHKIYRMARLNRLGNMLGELNHHINNPLAIIDASLYRFRPTQENNQKILPAQDQQLQTIDNSIARIQYIINDLRLFARVDQKESATLETVRNTCKNLLLVTEDICQRSQTHLQFIDMTQNMMFPCRPHQLVRMLSALVINACEAGMGFKGFNIVITIKSSTKDIQFLINDSGPGISSELQPHLFEPFFTTKPTHSHAGLSLATAKAVLEEWGGSLNFDPQSQGCSFKVMIPLDGPLSVQKEVV